MDELNAKFNPSIQIGVDANTGGSLRAGVLETDKLFLISWKIQ
jgi:hypothetical protein